MLIGYENLYNVFKLNSCFKYKNNTWKGDISKLKLIEKDFSYNGVMVSPYH